MTPRKAKSLPEVGEWTRIPTRWGSRDSTLAYHRSEPDLENWPHPPGSSGVFGSTTPDRNVDPRRETEVSSEEYETAGEGAVDDQLHGNERPSPDRRPNPPEGWNVQEEASRSEKERSMTPPLAPPPYRILWPRGRPKDREESTREPSTTIPAEPTGLGTRAPPPEPERSTPREDTGHASGGIGDLPRVIRTTVEAIGRRPGVTPGGGRPRKPIPLGKYDGVTMDWEDFAQHFDLVSRGNRWEPEEKGLYLAASLTGSARVVLKGLSGAECQEFPRVYTLLKEKFDNRNRVESYRTELRNYRRTVGTTLLTYADGLERLLDSAYPQLPGEIRQLMAVDAFLRGLPPGELRLHTQLRRCTTLRQAYDFASHFELAEEESRQKGERADPGKVRCARVEESGERPCPWTIGTSPEFQAKWTARFNQLEQALKQRSEKSPGAVALVKTELSTEVKWKRLEQLEAVLKKIHGPKPKCFVCGEPDHFARECGRRKKKTDSHEAKTRTDSPAGNDTGPLLPPGGRATGTETAGKVEEEIQPERIPSSKGGSGMSVAI